MIRQMRILSVCVMMFTTLVIGSSVESIDAADFPAKGKAIMVIVPWPAGGGTDVTGRMIAQGMEQVLGVPVQIVNKPGGNSQLGLSALTAAKPDGYTLGITNIPSIMPAYLDPGRKASYGRKDILQVANSAWDPIALVTKGDSQYKSVAEIVAAAKANPGKVSIGVPGLLSDAHIGALLFEKQAGVKFNFVQLEGAAGLTKTLLGGHIQLGINTATNWAGLSRAGEVRVLAIADKDESRFFPGVKTFEAQGFPVNIASSRGVSAPAGTPKEIVKVLADSIQKAMQAPEFKKRFADSFLTERFMGPEEYSKYWDEVERDVRPFVTTSK